MKRDALSMICSDKLAKKRFAISYSQCDQILKFWKEIHRVY